MKRFNRIISSVVLICFTWNTAVQDYAFALSPESGFQGSGLKDFQTRVYATGQKELATHQIGPGSGIAASADKYTPGEFVGDVPLPDGMEFASTDPTLGLPDGWGNNYLLMKDESDIVEAFKWFRDNEAGLNGDMLEIVKGDFKLEKDKEGQIPICRIEQDQRTNKYRLVIHKDFVRMWEDIKANDVRFKYKLPNGEVRTVSLAWGIFYRIAKHEMTDLVSRREEDRYNAKRIPGQDTARSHGHMEYAGPHHAGNNPGFKVNENESLANAIGGNYAIANDATWMFFLASYCFGPATQYNDAAFKDRALFFLGQYEGPNALEWNRWSIAHNLPDEFPNLRNSYNRDIAMGIARAVNKEFWTKYQKHEPYIDAAEEAAMDDGLAQRAPYIKRILPATGNDQQKPPAMHSAATASTPPAKVDQALDLIVRGFIKTKDPVLQSKLRSVWAQAKSNGDLPAIQAALLRIEDDMQKSVEKARLGASQLIPAFIRFFAARAIDTISTQLNSLQAELSAVAEIRKLVDDFAAKAPTAPDSGAKGFSEEIKKEARTAFDFLIKNEYIKDMIVGQDLLVSDEVAELRVLFGPESQRIWISVKADKKNEDGGFHYRIVIEVPLHLDQKKEFTCGVGDLVKELQRKDNPILPDVPTLKEMLEKFRHDKKIADELEQGLKALVNDTQLKDMIRGSDLIRTGNGTIVGFNVSFGTEDHRVTIVVQTEDKGPDGRLSYKITWSDSRHPNLGSTYTCGIGKLGAELYHGVVLGNEGTTLSLLTDFRCEQRAQAAQAVIDDDTSKIRPESDLRSVIGDAAAHTAPHSNIIEDIKLGSRISTPSSSEIDPAVTAQLEQAMHLLDDGTKAELRKIWAGRTDLASILEAIRSQEGSLRTETADMERGPFGWLVKFSPLYRSLSTKLSRVSWIRKEMDKFAAEIKGREYSWPVRSAEDAGEIFRDMTKYAASYGDIWGSTHTISTGSNYDMLILQQAALPGKVPGPSVKIYRRNDSVTIRFDALYYGQEIWASCTFDPKQIQVEYTLQKDSEVPTGASSLKTETYYTKGFQDGFEGLDFKDGVWTVRLDVEFLSILKETLAKAKIKLPSAVQLRSIGRREEVTPGAAVDQVLSMVLGLEKQNLPVTSGLLSDLISRFESNVISDGSDRTRVLGLLGRIKARSTDIKLRNMASKALVRHDKRTGSSKLMAKEPQLTVTAADKDNLKHEASIIRAKKEIADELARSRRKDMGHIKLSVLSDDGRTVVLGDSQTGEVITCNKADSSNDEVMTNHLYAYRRDPNIRSIAQAHSDATDDLIRLPALTPDFVAMLQERNTLVPTDAKGEDMAELLERTLRATPKQPWQPGDKSVRVIGHSAVLSREYGVITAGSSAKQARDRLDLIHDTAVSHKTAGMFTDKPISELDETKADDLLKSPFEEFRMAKADNRDPAEWATKGKLKEVEVDYDTKAVSDTQSKLLEIGKKIDARGLVVGPGGNISAVVDGKTKDGKDVLIMLIKASGKSFANMSAEQYIGVAIDMAGGNIRMRLVKGLVPDEKLIPSTEAMSHAAWYLANKEIRAITHAHSPVATGLAIARKDVMLHGKPVKWISYVFPGAGEMPKKIRDAVSDGQTRALIIENHGPITAGANLDEAFGLLTEMEDTAENMAAKRAGEIAAAKHTADELSFLQKAVKDAEAELNKFQKKMTDAQKGRLSAARNSINNGNSHRDDRWYGLFVTSDPDQDVKIHVDAQRIIQDGVSEYDYKRLRIQEFQETEPGGLAAGLWRETGAGFWNVLITLSFVYASAAKKLADYRQPVEGAADRRTRDGKKRFMVEPGQSPEDAMTVILLSPCLQKKLSNPIGVISRKDYRIGYHEVRKAYPWLKFKPTISYSTISRDLDALCPGGEYSGILRRFTARNSRVAYSLNDYISVFNEHANLVLARLLEKTIEDRVIKEGLPVKKLYSTFRSMMAYGRNLGYYRFSQILDAEELHGQIFKIMESGQLPKFYICTDSGFEGSPLKAMLHGIAITDTGVSKESIDLRQVPSGTRLFRVVAPSWQKTFSLIESVKVAAAKGVPAASIPDTGINTDDEGSYEPIDGESSHERNELQDSFMARLPGVTAPGRKAAAPEVSDAAAFKTAWENQMWGAADKLAGRIIPIAGEKFIPALKDALNAAIGSGEMEAVALFGKRYVAITGNKNIPVLMRALTDACKIGHLDTAISLAGALIMISGEDAVPAIMKAAQAAKRGSYIDSTPNGDFAKRIKALVRKQAARAKVADIYKITARGAGTEVAREKVIEAVEDTLKHIDIPEGVTKVRILYSESGPENKTGRPSEQAIYEYDSAHDTRAAGGHLRMFSTWRGKLGPMVDGSKADIWRIQVRNRKDYVAIVVGPKGSSKPAPKSTVRHAALLGLTLIGLGFASLAIQHASLVPGFAPLTYALFTGGAVTFLSAWAERRYGDSESEESIWFDDSEIASYHGWRNLLNDIKRYSPFTLEVSMRKLYAVLTHETGHMFFGDSEREANIWQGALVTGILYTLFNHFDPASVVIGVGIASVFGVPINAMIFVLETVISGPSFKNNLNLSEASVSANEGAFITRYEEYVKAKDEMIALLAIPENWDDNAKAQKILDAKNKVMFALEELRLESEAVSIAARGVKYRDIFFNHKTKEIFEYNNDGSMEKLLEFAGPDIVVLRPLSLSLENRKLRDEYVAKLRSRDRDVRGRMEALRQLKAMVEAGILPVPFEVDDIFQHCHSTYSHSPGYTPSYIAWRGYVLGLQVTGIVDHDTVAGFEEFRNAAGILGLRNPSCGYEQRVVPKGTPFEDGMDTNSPGNFNGETYIAFHGVARSRHQMQEERVIPAKVARFKKTAEFINKLTDLGLDYDRDIEPLTEAGNPTEKHVAEAIAKLIDEKFGVGTKKGADWNGAIAYTNDLIKKCCEAAGNTKDLTIKSDDDVGKLKNEDRNKFTFLIRDRVVTILKQTSGYMPTEDEVIRDKDVYDDAHNNNELVYYCYLGDLKKCKAENRDVMTPEKKQEFIDNMKKKGQSLPDFIIEWWLAKKDASMLHLWIAYQMYMGIDGIAFMPNRDRPQEIEDVIKLANEATDFMRTKMGIRFKHLSNGMDVNTPDMPFTYFDYSNRPEFVEESLFMVEHERKMRQAIRTAEAAGVSGISSDIISVSNVAVSEDEKNILTSTKNDAQRIQLVKDMFVRFFGRAWENVTKAHGRDNAQGEHVDYNQKQFEKGMTHLFSMGGAIQNNFLSAVGRRDDGIIRVVHADEGKIVEFKLKDLKALQAIAILERKDKVPAADRVIPVWANHTMGVLMQAYDRKTLRTGADIVLTSNVPYGAGLSNSAANCVAVTMGFNDMLKWGMSLEEIVAFARDGEHDDFVGSTCGWLDQLLIVFSKAGFFAMIDYATKKITYFKSKLPETFQRVLVNTNVPHDLAQTEYTDRNYGELPLAHETLAALLPEREIYGSTSLTLGEINRLINFFGGKDMTVDFADRTKLSRGLVNDAEFATIDKDDLPANDVLRERFAKLGYKKPSYEKDGVMITPHRHKDLTDEESFALCLRRMRHQLTSAIRTPLTGKAAEAGDKQSFMELIDAEGSSLRMDGDFQITGDNGAQDKLLDIGLATGKELGIDVCGRMEGGGGGGNVGFYVDRIDEGFYQKWCELVTIRYNEWAATNLKSKDGEKINASIIEPILSDGASVVDRQERQPADDLPDTGQVTHPSQLANIGRIGQWELDQHFEEIERGERMIDAGRLVVGFIGSVIGIGVISAHPWIGAFTIGASILIALMPFIHTVVMPIIRMIEGITMSNKISTDKREEIVRVLAQAFSAEELARLISIYENIVMEDPLVGLQDPNAALYAVPENSDVLIKFGRVLSDQGVITQARDTFFQDEQMGTAAYDIFFRAGFTNIGGSDTLQKALTAAKNRVKTDNDQPDDPSRRKFIKIAGAAGAVAVAAALGTGIGLSQTGCGSGDSGDNSNTGGGTGTDLGELQLGINYRGPNAEQSYGQNFGVTVGPDPWYPAGNGISKQQNRDRVAADFDAMKARGINIVRMSLLDDGRTLLDENYNVVGYNQTFKDDVKALLDIANAKGMKIEFCLTDYFIANPNGHYVNGVYVRAIVMQTSAKQKAFIDNFLVPFLGEFGDNAAIAGFDIINEPEWAMVNFGATREDMRQFITACLSAIRANTSGKPVTVGVNVEHADLISGLGLDYVALHCYNGTAALEAVAKNLPGYLRQRAPFHLWYTA